MNRIPDIGSHQLTDGQDEAGKDAAELVKIHGDDADIVAAHRADLLFRQGDSQGGNRWLKAFQRIALSHLVRAR